MPSSSVRPTACVSAACAEYSIGRTGKRQNASNLVERPEGAIRLETLVGRRGGLGACSCRTVPTSRMASLVPYWMLLDYTSLPTVFVEPVPSYQLLFNGTTDK